MNDYELTPIAPADVQVGMRVRITISIKGSGAWLPYAMVAEGMVTHIEGDHVVLDGDPDRLNPIKLEGNSLCDVKIERAPFAFRTVVLGHQSDEDIDSVWAKRGFGWANVNDYTQADEIVVTKVLWTPPAVTA